jgi:hypothetical protein
MRRTFQVESVINETDIVMLPNSLPNLSKHRVKLTLIDLADRHQNQFTVGYGDYTKEREQLFDHLTLEEILTEIKHLH